MAYTAGQKVRATDLNTGLTAALVVGGSASSGLRVATGTGTVTFSAVSFAFVAINYSGAGFTSAPLVLATATNGGSQRIVFMPGTASTTAVTLTAVTADSTNLTASNIPFGWIAIGV